MKVKVEAIVEISDEDRKRISGVLGVRQATRDQLKEFLWRHGENWRAGLAPDDLESIL